MSMLCSLYRITPEQVTRLKTVPDAVGELVGLTTPPPQVSFLSKLFGRSRQPPSASGRQFEPVPASDIFELAQAWHILHFLFSGTAAEGAWPRGFLMSGGEAIGPDLGYGPVRLLTPGLSRDVAKFLDAQSFQTLDLAYVAGDIEAADIYWRVSPERTERQRQLQELWEMVQGLQAFFAQTVEARHATLVSIY